MLNWRWAPDDGRRMTALAIRSQQTDNEIVRVRHDTEQIEGETKQIRNEPEQPRPGNACLRVLHTKMRSLISPIDQFCFPPESSLIPQ
jgi:hypothetical protein